MSLTIASWNINSVRLRLPLVLQFLQESKVDILCLQETKCPNELFPAAAFHEAGYQHSCINGQKGLHGVAILSKLPLLQPQIRVFCAKNDCRHCSAMVEISGKKILIHNIYAPAGGDIPDPQLNPKFAHKLQFIDELGAVSAANGAGISALLLGDLNIAPLEHDVWSHKQMLKIVSHTPVEIAALQKAQQQGGWADVLRAKVPPHEKLYTWWSYRARNWQLSDRGRRLDHIWSSPDLLPHLDGIEIIKAARSQEKPSDHVPVLARFSF